MTSTFQKFFLASAIVAAAAMTAQTAKASNLLNVPFSFTVAGHACPASTYVVDRGPVSMAVHLRSMDGSCSFAWIAGPGDPAPTDTRVVLRFDEMGQRHELQSVQYGALITSRLDHKGRKSEYVPTRIIMGGE